MSLDISNFSLEEQQILYCNNNIELYVDVIDDEYTIDLTKTKFTINNEDKSYTYTTILNGYRLNYSLLIDKTLNITIIAANSNDEVKTRDYILKFGYEVFYNKVDLWKPGTEIPIAITAENLAVRAKEVNFSTFFKTVPYKESGFEATISVEGSGYNDLNLEIKPQYKYFVYGGSYSILISGIKDFSGNILPDFMYSFKLEDKD